MKRSVLCLSFIFLSITGAWSQHRFHKTYGNLTPAWTNGALEIDGGYLFLGTVYSAKSESNDIYLARTNDNGDTVWTKSFGTENMESGNSIIKTSDGGYIICGYTGEAGNTDYLLIKLNSDCDTLWTRTFGSTREDYAIDIVQAADGGYLIAGNYYGINSGDWTFIKTDSQGKLVWSKIIESPNLDIVKNVFRMKDNTYVISGYSNSRPLIVKIDNGGNVVWSWSSVNARFMENFSTIQTVDGGFIMAGVATKNGYQDILLLRLNKDGIPQWAKSYGTSDIEYPYDICATEDGYLVTGMIVFKADGRQKSLIANIDTSGDITWANYYGEEAYMRGLNIIKTSGDNGALIIGESISLDNKNKRIHAIKTNAGGDGACSTTALTLDQFQQDSTMYDTKMASVIMSLSYSFTNIGIISGSNMETVCEKLGITNPGTLHLTVFPNPANNQLTIERREPRNMKIYLFDNLGHCVYSCILDNESTIKTDNIPDGLYMLQCISDSGIFYEKISIVH